MKKSTFYAGLAILSAGLLASCSSDPDFDDLETISVSEAQLPYGSDGVWQNNDKPGNLNIDDYIFTHSIDDYGMVYGFTPSKISDTTEHSPLYSFPYASAFGGGVKGKGSQYLVGYWPEFLDKDANSLYERHCAVWDDDGDRFEPQSVMVCCNTYLEYAALNGTAFSPAFKAGDYVTLVAHGVHQDGTESQAVFYLVNIEDSNVKEGILMAWEKFDLSGLGACTGLYFTMDCSETLKENGEIMIPTYFCIDNLVVKD